MNTRAHGLRSGLIVALSAGALGVGCSGGATDSGLSQSAARSTEQAIKPGESEPVILDALSYVRPRDVSCAAAVQRGFKNVEKLSGSAHPPRSILFRFTAPCPIANASALWIAESPVSLDSRTTLELSANVALVFQGALNAPRGRLIKGDGRILFGPSTTTEGRELYPEWWGAAADGVTDDHTAIQNAVTSLNGQKGTISFDSDKHYRSAEMVWIKQGGIALKGRATIHCESDSYTTMVIPGVSEGAGIASCFLFWDGSMNRHFVDPEHPFDEANYGNQLLSDILVEGLTFQDRYEYMSPFQPINASHALTLVGVKNVRISGNTFRGFGREVLIGDVAWVDTTIENNHFEECAHDGIAPVVAIRNRFLNNSFFRVFQPIESSAMETEIGFNTIDYCRNNCIWIGGTSLNSKTSATIHHNKITHAEATGSVINITVDVDKNAPLPGSQFASVYDVKINDNEISGHAGSYFIAFANILYPKELKGSVQILNNVMTESGDVVNYNAAIGAYSNFVDAGQELSLEIRNNIMNLTQSRAYVGLAVRYAYRPCDGCGALAAQFPAQITGNSINTQGGTFRDTSPCWRGGYAMAVPGLAPLVFSDNLLNGYPPPDYSEQC